MERLVSTSGGVRSPQMADTSASPPRLSVPTLAEVLELLGPSIPPALLGAHGWRRMLAVARQLPSAAALTGFGFEFRLQPQDPVADIGVLVPERSAVSSHYIARGAAEDADGAAIALRNLLLEVERGGSRRSREIGGVVLEYDVARRGGRIAAPGVFLSAPGFRADRSAGHANPGPLVDALCAACGCPEQVGNRRAVERVFAALPPAARVSHGGMFPTREPQVIRLNVTRMEHVDLAAALVRLGWPGAPDPVVGILSEFRDLTPCFRLALDISEGRIGPRLGLEMLQGTPTNWFGSDAATWRSFIDRLEERGWCRPDKAAGLRAWTGCEMMFDRTDVFHAHRRVHHFKFDVRNGSVAAKAYVITLFVPTERRGPADSGGDSGVSGEAILARTKR